jgi:transketolase
MAPTSSSKNALDDLTIQTLRTLSIDTIEKAKSGHPGLPLGAAPMAFTLWHRHLKVDPTAPKWPDRDRFVLSAGHGSALLYSLLHLAGYDLSLEALKAFRQWGSLTPGHPEFGLTPGVEATTGPLGQGAANAVGMAMAERRLAALFNRPGHTLVDHFTYALVSDGDLMEGVAAEAASLAGQFKLGKLIYLYDANDITLDGPTSLTFDREDVCKRFEAYGWHVLRVENGDTDLDALDRAISAAKAETQKPTLILVKTTIGFGSPNRAGTSSVHGSPLGPDETKLTKAKLGWNYPEAFFVPSEARQHFQELLTRGRNARTEWTRRWESYQREFPDLAALWKNAHAEGGLPTSVQADIEAALKNIEIKDAAATRQHGGTVINALAKAMPWILGGDADLGCSTNTLLKGQGDFEGVSGKGANVHYGVREHAMASLANGMAYHGGVRPYIATFFCFADYMRPAIRLAAMNHLPVIYVWTHDSIGLGEDGPTHQPVEHLMSLRCMPNLHMYRPADSIETKGAWAAALRRTHGPSGIVLTRQKVPQIATSFSGRETEIVEQGAYVVHAGSANPKVTLIATGSEVGLALETAKHLEQKGISARMISMPCVEAFRKLTPDAQAKVLGSPRSHTVSIEAGSTLGWQVWADLNIGIDRFGASAPAEHLFREFGLTAETITAKIIKHLSKL